MRNSISILCVGKLKLREMSGNKIVTGQSGCGFNFNGLFLKSHAALDQTLNILPKIFELIFKFICKIEFIA